MGGEAGIRDYVNSFTNLSSFGLKADFRVALGVEYVSTVSEPSTIPEAFTADQSRVLRKHFTNTDRPVFALINLPETVKGALFARYSRSAKSLRRLFLDEFLGDVSQESPDHQSESDVGTDRAARLYERVLNEYGDDSVAQL